jgi:hypothetical protein
MTALSVVESGTRDDNQRTKKIGWIGAGNHQNVLGLEVSVKDSSAMAVLHGTDELSHNLVDLQRGRVDVTACR